MRLGLGISIVEPHRLVGASVPVYDPTDDEWIVWTQAPYAGNPWAGTASAGLSSNRDWTQATYYAAVGAQLNGHAVADFDGSNDYMRLQIAGTGQTLAGTLGTTAWSIAMLVYADAVGHATVPNSIGDSSGFWGLGVRDSSGTKAFLYQYDTAARYAQAAMNLEEWTLLQARFTGTAIQVRVNSGAWVSTTAAACGYTAGEINIGRNYASSYFNGKVASVLIAKDVSHTDEKFDEIITYVNDRFALSL